VSLDTIAIFDVRAPLEPVDLMERLASDPALAALVPRYGPEWDPTDWSVEPSQVHPRAVDLVGPGGLVLRLGRRSVEVYHLLRFSRFASGGEDQRVLRRAFRAIARTVGSTRALYTHELAATDRDPELGLDPVIASLSAIAGPPAPSLAELARGEPYREGSWFVDTFADLDAN
jgi:hypothetical protein